MWDSSLIASTIHHFSLVSLDQLLRHKYFSILQFHGDPLHDFLGGACFSIPIFYTNLSCLSEPDVVENAEIEIID